MDDDIEEHVSAERAQILGFEPQQELNCNKYLPYADKLDDESQENLRLIKDALGRAVALRDMNPGIGMAVGKLSMYIKLYGLKFSKEDHIKFIHLLLELITIPNLEVSKTNKFCMVLLQLLNKSKWLSPDDIQIEWKPLYKLARIILDKNSNKGDLYRFFVQSGRESATFPVDSHLISLASRFGIDLSSTIDTEEPSLQSNLQGVIQRCSIYFPQSATQEILDEVFAKFQPLDTGKSSVVFEMLSLFLNPIKGYELWLDNFINLYDMYHNPPWSHDLMNTLALVAAENIGQIDWEPYMPVIFTRILRSVDLPVSYKQTKSSKSQCLWPGTAAIWIVSVLSPTSSCQKHLTKFMGAIESYIHPANFGRWSVLLGEIILQLPKQLQERLILERYRPHPWKKSIPEEQKLTEKCITEFVECIKPLAFQLMYSRIGEASVTQLFKYLADLRPELIIPGVIERIYTNLESVTEPHRLTASLQCLIGVSRALVTGHNGYTEGRTHVIPICFAILPGMDQNDFKKTSITLQFLTMFALFIPIVDCSKASQYYNDLTDEERLICEQTAEFENFVLQYLDRLFVLIESSSIEFVRSEQSCLDNARSKIESVVEALLSSCTLGLLGQCSQEILTTATNKFVNFVKTHIFEPRVAGQLVGALVRSFARVATKQTYKALVPFLTETIQQYFDDYDDIANAEKLNDDVLYYLILLMYVLRNNTDETLVYLDQIICIVDQVVKFKCKLAIRTVSNIVVNIMSSISTMQTIDMRTSPDCFTQPLSEVLPIRRWGEKMKTDDKINWFIPNEACRYACEKLLHRYVPQILENFANHINDTVPMAREDIVRDLTLLISFLRCSNFLPEWNEENIELVSTVLGPKKIHLYPVNEDLVIEMPDGSNVRKTVIESIAKLQSKIMETSEDDVKSLHEITNLWSKVHCSRNSNPSFAIQMKHHYNSKSFQQCKLTKKICDIRAVVASRTNLQQEIRDNFKSLRFTQTHKFILKNLLELSTSQYSYIRSYAQIKLASLIKIHPFSFLCILDDLVKVLELNPNDNHESFKGVLFLLGGMKKSRLIAKNHWLIVKKLWVALINSQPSKKPSIVKLLDVIMVSIGTEFTTLSIEIEIENSCVQKGIGIMASQNSILESEIAAGQLTLEEKNSENLTLYNSVVSMILDSVYTKSLGIHHNLTASQMLVFLVHPKTIYPANVVNYCVNNLINDSIEERKIAIRTFVYVLRQNKRPHKKMTVDPFAIAGVERPDGVLLPGTRPDNEWLQYDVTKVPKNQFDWDQPKYIHKCDGYFGWSANFEVYAPTAEQPNVNRNRDEMTEIERIIYDFFIHKPNVDKLIEYWSLEEKKGAEKYNQSKFFIIKSIFGLFGESLLENFLWHLPRLIEQKNIESNHRCAAELMAGIMRGAKHWSYDQTENLYEKLKPLVRMALNNITVETDMFWGTCFATASEHIDPSRQYWLHEVLLESPLRETTSFIDCSRLFCLQGAFNQHVWRMNSVSHRLLDYLRPFLTYPFQNVRERLANLLINIFEGDLEYPNANDPSSPRIKNIISEVMPRLEILHKNFPKQVKDKSSDEPMELDNNDENKDSEYDEAVRLFKTITQWIVGNINRSTNGNRIEYFELLPLACRLDRCEHDVELAETCTALLSMIAQALTLPDCMGGALEKIREVSMMPSWSARLAVIDVLQIIVFHNMFVVLSRKEWVAQVQEIVLHLLEDSVFEVREKAGQVLCGLIHCAFLPATDQLIALFKRKCKTKVIKHTARRIVSTEPVANACKTEAFIEDTREVNAVRLRHTGVLGLCAFIAAFPYDIPDFVPDVFEYLGAHLNDPQPIPTTIRKTMGDFKRTHHDNWATYKLKFTEDQLSVLTDLTVSPSYYA